MSGIEDRSKGMEAKLAHDNELRFKVMNRRNKLLGLWAADLLGKTGDDASSYAKEVVMSDFEEAGDDDVLRKVAGDLKATGTTDAHIRAEMERLLHVAHDQIVSDA
ncbi:MAG: DUF1476 domain-containing protein [Phycisphaerales bacterium JB063]